MQKWTEQQNNAINARNSNIIVSAAAGSGKTAVLVERVIKMITDPQLNIDIDQLLIVTFTNAAASEMKNRIAKSLNKILETCPNDSNALLQLSLLPNAKISTIDSFCINLVRENFFNLSLSQDFTILENSQEKIIESEVLNEIIEDYYEKYDENFGHLIDLLSNEKNDNNLLNTIRDINNFIKAQPFPYLWLDKACELYNPNIDLDNSELKKQIVIELKYYFQRVKSLFKSEFEALAPDDELYDELYSMIMSDKSIVDNIENGLNGKWDDLYNALNSYHFVDITRKRKSVSKKDVKLYRDEIKKIIKNNMVPLVCMKKDDYFNNCKEVYPLVLLLARIVKEFNDAVLQRKLEINSFSFSDVEHFAIDLLFEVDESGNIIRKPLAEEYENNFKEILVDEYQDTNRAQDTLFEKISNGKNRFMVGDIKQSIYRFRLAMPEIFNEKKQNFAPYSENSDEINQKIILDKNFRSRREVCEFTNFIFSNLMSEHIGEIDYNDEEKLNSHNDYEETNAPCAGLRIVEFDENQNIKNYEFEATQIAQFIKSKIDGKEKIKDGDEYREIRYGDFAVLFRSPKDRMPAYAKILSDYGITVVANNKKNLLENNEIVILLSLLRVIDNPIQDIPLLATLMSVFYGYTTDEISKARIDCNAKNLYTAISKKKDIFGKFLNDLEKYRSYAASMSVEDFIRQIIEETSYLSIITAMGDAQQRKANLSKFIDIAKRFDSGSNVGLTAFLRYIDSVIKQKYSIESASVSNSSDNAVKLTSIHNSKGLEFPVVILADSTRRYNYDDLKKNVLLNSDFGIGMKIFDSDNLCRYQSLQFSCLKEKNKRSLMSENLRVLYVALTRAKEQFYVFSTYKNEEFKKHLNSLSEKIIDGKINSTMVKDILNDADAILLCALLHKDCKELREAAGVDYLPQSGYDFKFDCKFLNQFTTENMNVEVKVDADEEVVNAIADKLSYSYPYKNLASVAAKRTASSLDREEQGFEYFATSMPAFLNEGGMTPAEKGTAMHNFMQYCDYKNSKDNLCNEIERLVNGGYLTRLQADNLNVEKLNKLFSSDFADRMFNSDRILREVKVSCFVPVNEIENTEYTDEILVQGIADCVFEENGELVLVDYKTDRVESEEALLSKYSKQIGFYKKAIEKTLEKPVKEALLYSFFMDKTCVYK